MNIGNRTANAICFLIATASFSVILHSHILYVANYNSTNPENENKKIRVSHSESERHSFNSRSIGN